MSIRSWTISLLALSAGLCMSLTACHPSGVETSPSSTPTAPATSEVLESVPTTPTPVPASAAGPGQNIPIPRISNQGKEISEDGAVAFLYHYFDLMNYALETYDADPLTKVTSRSCLPCGQNFIDPLRANAELGHWQVGGKYDIEVTSAKLNEQKEATLVFNYSMGPTTMYKAPKVELEHHEGMREHAQGVAVLKAEKHWMLLDFNFSFED